MEKEMATQSSTLAWKIPWTEDPGRPQPIQSQRVRQDQPTEHTRTHAKEKQTNKRTGHRRNQFLKRKYMYTFHLQTFLY